MRSIIAVRMAVARSELISFKPAFANTAVSAAKKADNKANNNQAGINSYFITLNVINIVVPKRQSKPTRKHISATFSKRSLILLFLLRIAKKERILLIMNKIIAAVVNSSTMVSDWSFNKRSDVRTIKQIPSKLDDVLRICGDVFFLSSIIIIVEPG